MKTPYKALDLPPRLTTTEWVWFFEYVTSAAAADLRKSVDTQTQMEQEIAILGRPIPYKGTMEIDPDDVHIRLAGNRTSFQRIIDMAVYLLRKAQAASVDEFTEDMAAFFSQKGKK